MFQILLLIYAVVCPTESYINSTILLPFHLNKYHNHFIPARNPINNFIPPNRIPNNLWWYQNQQSQLKHSWYPNRNAAFYNPVKQPNHLNTLIFPQVPQQWGYHNYDCSHCCNCCQSCRQLSPEFLYPHPIQIIKQQPKPVTIAKPAPTTSTATTPKTTTSITTTKRNYVTTRTSITTTSSESATTPLATTTESTPATTNIITSEPSVASTTSSNSSTATDLPSVPPE